MDYLNIENLLHGNMTEKEIIYYEELMHIGQILNNPDITFFNKIAEVLLYEFNKYRQIGKNYFSIQDIMAMTINPMDIPPSIVDIRKVERLIDCLVFLSKNLITKQGIAELYPEFSDLHLQSYVLWDILYDETTNSYNYDILDIFNMANSKDVEKIKKKIRKGVYGNYKKFKSHLDQLANDGLLTYVRYKEEKNRFIKVYGKTNSQRYLGRLKDFESTYKFKIDKYIFNRLKQMRKDNIYSYNGLDIIEILDLKEVLAPILYSRIQNGNFFWKGLKGEFKRISRMKKGPARSTRKDVFIFRYERYSERIIRLWHLESAQSVAF